MEATSPSIYVIDGVFAARSPEAAHVVQSMLRETLINAYVSGYIADRAMELDVGRTRHWEEIVWFDEEEDD